MTSSFVYEKLDTILSVEGVSHTFKRRGSKTPSLVLRDINVSVQNIVRPGINQGQIIALLGPSGRGKTTLFRILAGLLKPTTGTVFIGRDLRPVSADDVGVVAQHYPLAEYFTVFQNLVFAGKKSGRDQKASEETALQYLDEFRLADHRDKYPDELSGGQRQRVAIAQQVICSEHFILMDEPFSGLDVVAKKKARKIILDASCKHEENTFIITTHSVRDALSVADTVWLMGWEYDEAGKPRPGATIVNGDAPIDLIERDMCWHEDPLSTPAATELIREIEERFDTL